MAMTVIDPPLASMLQKTELQPPVVEKKIGVVI